MCGHDACVVPSALKPMQADMNTSRTRASWESCAGALQQVGTRPSPPHLRALTQALRHRQRRSRDGRSAARSAAELARARPQSFSIGSVRAAHKSTTLLCTFRRAPAFGFTHAAADIVLGTELPRLQHRQHWHQQQRQQERQLRQHQHSRQRRQGRW
eukprot:162532-Chlamydomonas_euryale.AAC.1